MGKHEWMTRRTSRSRYPDVSNEQDLTVPARRLRWRISRPAAWVAAGLIAGVISVLWVAGAFAEPDRAVTRIDTAWNMPAKDGSSPRETSVEEPAGNSGAASSAQTTKTPQADLAPAGVRSPAQAGPSMLVVHVAGAVKDPGIVTLQQGSRVHEAISAAGGAQRKAQLAAVNLAAAVEDGQQLYVPERGELPRDGRGAAAPPPAGSAAAPAGPATGGAASEAAPLVNINTANATELSTLPGVGPVLSGRIVDWRAEHGAFSSVTELDAVSGIGEKMLATLGELVTV